MERHWILGLVALTTAALLWREVYSLACLSSKRLDNDNGVNGLEDCTNIEECAPDEVCYVEKFVTENNPSAVKYRAGCRNIRDCKLISCSNQVTESVPTPRVGKRYVDEISLCTECCYNDTCNTKGCGSYAIDPERAKYHKKCFNCQHIKENDHSTCKQMVWCEQPTQVCGISADPIRREYNLKCEFKKLCDKALVASNQSGAPLLLKCFDGHLQNYNPLSNHTATVVADILPCPTGIVNSLIDHTITVCHLHKYCHILPTTPTTTTQKTTTTTTAATTTAQKTTTTTTATTMTPKTTTTASTTPRVITSKTSPTTKSTTQSSTVVTSPKTTPTVPMTSTSKITTPLPTPTTVKVTTIKQPTLKTTITPPTTPKRPTLPPLTVTTTLAPTSPNTNSPSLPPTIPIATKVVTMAPITTTTKALPITTTTTPKPTTTATTPKPTTTTTTPKPTTTTTTPKPTTTTPKPTTTTTTAKLTTTTTTPKPTTTTTTPKPTTTMKTTTRLTTTPTTTELKTTTKAGPPAGHTIPPNPTVCFVCMDDAPDLCVDLYGEKPCEPPNNYCINQVTNYADGNKFVNRTCGNFDRCFKDWYHGSSDTDVCQTFDENQYITLDFECVYCCVKDRCNMQMKPPAETLYEDK